LPSFASPNISCDQRVASSGRFVLALFFTSRWPFAAFAVAAAAVPALVLAIVVLSSEKTATARVTQSLSGTRSHDDPPSNFSDDGAGNL
jgi:hypothetical protein